MTLTYSWCPGHEDVPKNEEADEKAKEVAEGDTSHPNEFPHGLRKGLKTNLAATKREYRDTLRKQTRREWGKSTYMYLRKARTVNRRLNGKLEGGYLKLTQGMKRRRISILTQFRTGHAPLKKHLHKIGKNMSILQKRCGNSQALLMIAQNGKICVDNSKAYIDSRCSKELKHLLNKGKLLKGTLIIEDRMGRFKKTHGKGEETKRKWDRMKDKATERP